MVDGCDSLIDEWKYYGKKKKKGLTDYLHDMGRQLSQHQLVSIEEKVRDPKLTRSLFPKEFRDVWVRPFLQYRTALPSSASFERVFSYGSDILRAKRSSLAAQNFEALVFVKGNMKMLKKAHEVEYEEKERDEDEA